MPHRHRQWTEAIPPRGLCQADAREGFLLLGRNVPNRLAYAAHRGAMQ